MTEVREPIPRKSGRAKFIELRPAGGMVPGDGNGDGLVDLSDAIGILFYLFLGDPPRLPCGSGLPGDPSNLALLDSSGDGLLDVTDSIHVLQYLFIGGIPPVLGIACVPMTGCPEACTAEVALLERNCISRWCSLSFPADL